MPSTDPLAFMYPNPRGEMLAAEAEAESCRVAAAFVAQAVALLEQAASALAVSQRGLVNGAKSSARHALVDLEQSEAHAVARADIHARAA
jgi:hypothetical protein